MVNVLFLFRRVDCNDGIASYCETLIRGLQKRGARIIIASGIVNFSDTTRHRRDTLEKCSEEWLVIQSLTYRPNTFIVLRDILSLMWRRKVDVIFNQGFSVLPLAKVLSMLTGKPIVTNYHGGYASHIGERGSLKEKFYYRTCATMFQPKKYIALSSDTANFFRETCGIRDSKIEKFVLGIDTDIFRPPSSAERQAARNKLKISDDALVCILCARVSIDKGHPLVIEAIRSLQNSNKSFKGVCLFAGSVDETEGRAIFLSAQHSERDVGAFRFLGFLGKWELVQAFWASDVALLPSKIEGFPLAIAEAMASGCVPIRTPSGGASDQIIDRETGFIVPFDDSEALAKRLLELTDVALRARMSAAAASHAHTYFREETMIDNTIKLFREICRH